MSRYDLYGSPHLSLEDAALAAESALGIRLELRDSSYRGIYYRAGAGRENNYLLQSNSEGHRWHSRFPQYPVLLMVSELPAMDAIRDKLTAGTGFNFLHSIVHTEPPPEEYPPDLEE